MKPLLTAFFIILGYLSSFPQADSLNVKKPAPIGEVSYKKPAPAPTIIYTLYPPENRLVAFNQKSTYQAIKTNQVGSSATKLEFETELFDEGNRFKDGVFAVPYDGIYHFDISVSFFYGLTDWERNWVFELFLSSSPSNAIIEKSFMSFPATQLESSFTLAINTTRSLKKGEYMYASLRGTTSDGAAVNIYVSEASFSGSRISKF